VTSASGSPALRLTFLGHATVCIQLDGVVLLTDAVLRNAVAFLRWTAPAITIDLLHDVDATLISHLHHDHCDLASLAQLGRDRMLLAPAGAERFLRQRGFTRVVPMHVGQSHRVGTITVTATEAAHSGRREPFGPTADALGYLVDGVGVRLYFAGDTDLFPRMHDLDEPDVALLPVAGWGKRLGPGHLDPIRAAEAVELIRPRIAVPIHWGALQPFWYRRRPPEVTLGPPSAFDREVRRRRLDTDVVVLTPGATIASTAISTAADDSRRPAGG
jgi:L-ascorbate metabolism protein UlaG (beta-lactamase superfamily)